jgi:hypothetical protein
MHSYTVQEVDECRVNLDLPTVEVRVEDLHIETEVYAETGRQLPSLFNALRSFVEVCGNARTHSPGTCQ